MNNSPKPKRGPRAGASNAGRKKLPDAVKRVRIVAFVLPATQAALLEHGPKLGETLDKLTATSTTPPMMTFKNKNFTRRDPESTNIAACKATSLAAAIAAYPAEWVECQDAITPSMMRLHIINGVEIFGWL